MARGLQKVQAQQKAADKKLKEAKNKGTGGGLSAKMAEIDKQNAV
jgi:hypothetical protein